MGTPATSACPRLDCPLSRCCSSPAWTPTGHHPKRKFRVTRSPTFLCLTLRKCPNPFTQPVNPFSPPPSLHLLHLSRSLFLSYLDHQRCTLWFVWCGCPRPPSPPARRQATGSDLSHPRPFILATPPEGHTSVCTVLGIAGPTGPNPVSLQKLEDLMTTAGEEWIVTQITK